MKGAALKIRVLLEGFFLWFGGLGLYYVLIVLIEPHIHSGTGDAVLYICTALVLLTAAVWILVCRRKDLGDRISAAAYVILNIIPFIIAAVFTWLYLHSFD